MQKTSWANLLMSSEPSQKLGKSIDLVAVHLVIFSRRSIIFLFRNERIHFHINKLHFSMPRWCCFKHLANSIHIFLCCQFAIFIHSQRGAVAMNEKNVKIVQLPARKIEQKILNIARQLKLLLTRICAHWSEMQIKKTINFSIASRDGKRF